MYNSLTSFYMTLPSNVPNPASNKANSFKIHLATELELRGKWECALAEITYERNWRIFTDPITVYVHVYEPKATSRLEFNIRKWPIPVNNGIYSTTDSFIRHFFDCFKAEVEKQSHQDLKPIYHAMDYRFMDGVATIKSTYASPVKIFFPDFIGAMIGIETGALYLVNNSHQWIPPKQMRTTPSLYIYCDIIEDNIVGDVRAKLLRTVPVIGEQSDTINIAFAKLYYHPVRPGYISDVEMLICDDAGGKIQFGPAKTVIVLHLRKVGLDI